MKWSEILSPHEELNPKETLHVLFPAPVGELTQWTKARPDSERL